MQNKDERNPLLPPSFPLVTPFWLHKLAYYRPIGAPFRLIKLSFASTKRNGLATPNEVPAPGDATCYSAESSAPRRGSAAMGQPSPSLAGDAWCLYLICLPCLNRLGGRFDVFVFADKYCVLWCWCLCLLSVSLCKGIIIASSSLTLFMDSSNTSSNNNLTMMKFTLASVPFRSRNMILRCSWYYLPASHSCQGSVWCAVNISKTIDQSQRHKGLKRPINAELYIEKIALRVVSLNTKTYSGVRSVWEWGKILFWGIWSVSHWFYTRLSDLQTMSVCFCKLLNVTFPWAKLIMQLFFSGSQMAEPANNSSLRNNQYRALFHHPNISLCCWLRWTVL